MTGKKKTFVHTRHYGEAVGQKQQDMLANLEVFLHAYYDVLEETGGPPDKYRPQRAVNDGLDAVEHLWWASLDDDG